MRNYKTLSVRPEVYEQLRRLALAEDRPISTIIARSVAAYVERSAR